MSESRMGHQVVVALRLEHGTKQCERLVEPDCLLQPLWISLFLLPCFSTKCAGWGRFKLQSL